jgi:hypothetical protein
MEQIENFLKNPVWPEGLECGVVYERQHDDTDGGDDGHLLVQFSQDGDAWISIDCQKPLRFRNWGGGGRSLNTHAALMILAKAIQMDNEIKPNRGDQNE